MLKALAVEVVIGLPKVAGCEIILEVLMGGAIGLGLEREEVTKAALKLAMAMVIADMEMLTRRRYAFLDLLGRGILILPRPPLHQASKALYRPLAQHLQQHRLCLHPLMITRRPLRHRGSHHQLH